MLPIAVDAMGGDFAPRAVIQGVGEALDMLPGCPDMILVGDEARMRAELSAIGKLGHAKLSLVHAPDVVRMDDPSTAPLRSKKNSSISLAVELAKEGKVSAVVSAGHTGATMAVSVVKLRMLSGVDRPGIAAVMPNLTGHFVLLDAGANVDAKAEHLQQYGIMGSAFAEGILGIEKPRVGLLSVGTESEKGNELSKTAFKLLAAVPDINFIGNVEGHGLFDGSVDVVVCDGFVGNVVLKGSEALAKAIGTILKRGLTANPLRKAGAVLCRGAFTELKQKLDPEEYGGAIFLGVNGVVIKAHGSSSAKAIRNAIRVAAEFVDHRVNEKIVSAIGHLSAAPPPAAGGGAEPV